MTDHFTSLGEFTSAIKTTHIASSVVVGVKENNHDYCFGLNALGSRLSETSIEKSMGELVCNRLSGLTSALRPLQQAIDHTFSEDALLQPGFTVAKLETSEGGVLVSQIRGRAKTETFVLTQAQQEGFSICQREGLSATLHYIQNLFAIDLDLRTSDEQKAKLPTFKNIQTKGGRTFEEEVWTALQNPTIIEFVQNNLLALWETEHGYRLLFPHTPIETHSTTTKPFSPDLAKVDGALVQFAYKGFARKLQSAFPSKVELVDGRTIIMDWDFGTPSSNFALSRLPKVVKVVKDNMKVDLRQTDTFGNSGATALCLVQGGKHTSLFNELITLGKATQKVKDSLSATFSVVANADDKVFETPKNFASAEDKNTFCESLIQGYATDNLLTIWQKSPTMTYDAWFKIITNFRRLGQILEQMGADQKLVDQAKQMALGWSMGAKGYDNSTEYLINSIFESGSEACFSSGDIEDTLGKVYRDWLDTDKESKDLHRNHKGFSHQSIFANQWGKTYSTFKSNTQYSPATGKKVVVCGKAFLDAEGKEMTWNSLDLSLVEKILKADPLLPQVLKFSLCHHAVVVDPNISDVLLGATEGNFVQPTRDLLLWSPLEESTATGLRLYLKRVYKIKTEPSFDKLSDTLLAVISDQSRSAYQQYQSNLFYDKLLDRHQDYLAAKNQGRKVAGVSDYLQNWLPTMLHIDPTKSATHKKLYRLYGAYGRAFLIGLVQRAMSTNVTSKVENLLFIRGASGSGKTEIAKTLVSALFGFNSLSGFAGAEDFVHSPIGSTVPRERDDFSKLFGKIVLLFDDISTTTLKRVEQGHLKSFLSSTTDLLRLPYAKSDSHHNRTFATIATSNDRFLLNDLTSSRRYMIVDLDAVSEENGNFVCDLLDKGSLKPIERSSAKNSQCDGYIDLDLSEVLSLALGQAFDVGVLGQGLCDTETISGKKILASERLQSYYPLVGLVGKHDKSQSIRVEKPYLHPEDQLLSDEWCGQFQIGHIGVEDNKQNLNNFLTTSDVMGGLGDRTRFELGELKNYLKTDHKEVPSDSAFKLWAEGGVLAPNGKRYKFVSKRVGSGKDRKSLWVVVEESTLEEPKDNPFLPPTKSVKTSLVSTASQIVLNSKPSSFSLSL